MDYEILFRVKKAQEIIGRSEKAGVGLFIRDHGLEAHHPDLLNDNLLREINDNLAEVMSEILIVKVNEVIHDLDVTSEDLSYYFNNEWAEYHDDPMTLRSMARAVQTLRSNDEFFDTKH